MNQNVADIGLRKSPVDHLRDTRWPKRAKTQLPIRTKNRKKSRFSDIFLLLKLAFYCSLNKIRIETLKLPSKIKDFDNIFNKLVTLCAATGQPSPDRKKLHAYLTHNGHVIREVWVKELFAGNVIPTDKAAKVLGAINAKFIALGGSVVDPNTALVTADSAG